MEFRNDSNQSGSKDAEKCKWNASDALDESSTTSIDEI